MDSARAMATRWRSPPESSSGRCLQALPELDERQQLAGSLVDLLARPAPQVQRQADVFEAA